jgi:predicted permease
LAARGGAVSRDLTPDVARSSYSSSWRRTRSAHARDALGLTDALAARPLQAALACSGRASVCEGSRIVIARPPVVANRPRSVNLFDKPIERLDTIGMANGTRTPRPSTTPPGRLARLREWSVRCLGSLGLRRRDADLEAELRAHLEMATSDARRHGDADRGAARDAVLRHGAMAASIDAMRDQRGVRWIDDLGRDVRHSMRALGRAPSFTAVVLLTLALGIGANTAMFSLVDGIVLKPLPYPRPAELVSLRHTAPGAEWLGNIASDLPLSASMYVTYAEHNRTFSSLGVWVAGTATVTGVGNPEQVRRVSVSDGVLEALGIPPLVGRALGAADQAADAVVRPMMLGYGYWMRRFGGDPSVVGRTIDVDSRPHQVIGVMPQGFRIVDAEPDLIVPFAFDRRTLILPGFGLEAVGRLKPGVTMGEASADVARMVPIWLHSWPLLPGVDPTIYEAWHITPMLRPLATEVTGNVARVLWILLGTIGIVLLVACANVAGLMLVRLDGRQTELAVRAALGAGRGQIVRALVVESTLLAIAGGILGAALAAVGVQLLVRYGPDTLPRLHEVSVDARALAFALGAALVSSVLVGVIPALRYARLGPAEAVHGSRGTTDNRERRRARHGLVVAQVALALVLLVASGLMMRTFQSLLAVVPGFTNPDTIQTLRVVVPERLVPDPERVTRLQQDVVDRLAALPGVESVAFGSGVPMTGGTPEWDVISVEGRRYDTNETPPARFFKRISPGYFRTMGTSLVAGRDLTWTDLYDRRRVVIVSEGMARDLWGSAEAAIGKRVHRLPGSPWWNVVGVVRDVHEHGADAPAPDIVYWPAFGESSLQAGQLTATRGVTFTVRSSLAGSAALLTGIRRAVWAANASLSVASERTMREIYDASMQRTSFTLVLLGLAGVMALILSLVGLYGVLAYAVSRRTREIGIRLALGAPPRGIGRLFVGNGLRLTALGTVVGLVAAAALSRAMSSVLFGVSPLDPVTFAIAPLVLAAAAALASYLPARRASRIDAVRALQQE